MNFISLAYLFFKRLTKSFFIYLLRFGYQAFHSFPNICFSSKFFFIPSMEDFTLIHQCNEREALVELFFLSHIQMGQNITNPIILGTWSSFFHTISHLGNTYHYLTRNFRHLNFKGTLIWNRFAWNLKYSNNGTHTLVYFKELAEQEDANIVTFQRAIELQCWKEKTLWKKNCS